MQFLLAFRLLLTVDLPYTLYSYDCDNNKNTYKIVKIMPTTRCFAVELFKRVTADLSSKL